MDEKSGDTRSALIEAAIKLFAERGLEGTSTRAIAAEAGVNIGGIHYHYGSKEKLYCAAVTHAGAAGFHPFDPELLTEEALSTPEGVARTIAASLRARFATLYSDRYNPMHGKLISRAMLDSPAALNDVVDQILKPDTVVWTDLFRRARPEMSDEEAYFWVHSIVANLVFYNQNGAAVLKHLDREEFEEGYFERAAEHTIRIVLAGLGLPMPGGE